MFLLFVSLLFSQNEDYSNKSFKLMFFASALLNTNDKYYKNQQNIINMRSNAIQVAKKICFDDNEIKKYANSNEVSNKVTACYACAFGAISTVDEKLFKLLLDDNNIVTMAARESFVYIVNKKLNNFIIDQGPSHHADIDDKYLASAMWRLILGTHNLANDELSDLEEKEYNKFVDILEAEEAKNFFRKKANKQLELEDYYFYKSRFPQIDKEMEEKINPDFIDPNAYTVKKKTDNINRFNLKMRISK